MIFLVSATHELRYDDGWLGEVEPHFLDQELRW